MDDLRISDEFGFEFVRLGTFPFEMSNGAYDFGMDRKVFKEFLRRKIDTVLSLDLRPLTSIDTFPEMFNDPQAVLTDQNGQVIFQQDFRNFNFNHPELRRRWKVFIKAYVEAMQSLEGADQVETSLNFCNELHCGIRGSIVGRSPKEGEVYDEEREKIHHGYARLRKFFHPELGLVGDFDTGFHLTDYSTFTVEKFRKWLEIRHGSIEALNRRWGSACSGFDEADPPRELPFETAGRHAAWMDWLQFRFDDFLEMFSWVCKQAGDAFPVTHNFIASRYLMNDPFCGVDLWTMGHLLDRVDIDYPDIFDFYLLAATGKPYHVIEAAVGYSADYMYRETLLSAVGGALSINYWQTEMDYVSKRATAMQGVRQAWPFASRLSGRMTEAPVAVFYSHQSAFSALRPAQGAVSEKEAVGAGDDALKKLTDAIMKSGDNLSACAYFERVTSAWIALMESGYAAHPIGSVTLQEGNPDAYQAIIVPGADCLSDADIQALENYRGVLIATGVNWGCQDEWTHDAPGRISELFSCRRVSTWTGPASVQMDGVTFIVDGYDVFEPVNGARVIARTVDGLPVGIACGNRILLGFDLTAPAGFGIYDRLAREVLNLGRFRTVNPPDRAELFENLLMAADILPEVQGLLPGVWYSILREGDRIQLALFDYQNWYELWEKQFNPALCRWDGKNTQPRCVDFVEGVGPEIFAPDSKSFEITVRLPGYQPTGAFRDRSKCLYEISVPFSSASSGGIRLQVEGMEFLYVIEFEKSRKKNDVN